ncbi:MAG: SDR family oxidoreductase [Alistipes sp.]|nr:SDR family oxidoreductase [Alistipes sp.]
MTKIKGNCILITGGASGIGRLMGRIALEKGARQLVIWDINQASIESTEQEFSTLGNVKGYRIDISDSNAVVETFAKTTKECGNIDILINCAGIITSNRHFAEMSQQEIDRTIAINSVAPMTIALQALPPMLERNHGHICNIASAAGFIANPKMSVYAASKWAMIGWSDSLRVELQEAKSNVHITTIAPYYINTGMFDGVRSRIIPILKPEWVAKRIIKAIESNKKISSYPLGYHLIRILQAVLPLRALDLLCKVLGIYNALDHFKGRK